MSGDVERVLAEHEAEDRESGYFCRCGWVSEAWTHGETRTAHRAHVAEALAPVIRKREAAALREAATAVDAMSLLDDPSDPVHVHVGAKWLNHRADALDQGVADEQV